MESERMHMETVYFKLEEKFPLVWEFSKLIIFTE